nr:MAG TPA: hypothetical protein [Caudoviricetes sp.]
MKREFSAATLRLWLTSWEPCGDFQPWYKSLAGSGIRHGKRRQWRAPNAPHAA